MLTLACVYACVAIRQRCSRCRPKVQARGEEDEPIIGRSPSTAHLLPSKDRGKRAAAASALLDDCDEEEEEGGQDEDDELQPSRTLRARSTFSEEQMDVDAQEIYGMGLAEENGPSPRYELPHDLEADAEEDVDEEIGPDDSISVAWFKAHQPQAAPPPNAGEANAEPSRSIPVTIEAPDGSRHAMDVQLDGLKTMVELRRGMLQGYCELLGEQLPAHALRVHARLASGSTVLLLDSTPLQQAVFDAVSFYVWAAAPAPEPSVQDSGSSAVPSISQRKDRLGVR